MKRRSLLQLGAVGLGSSLLPWSIDAVPTWAGVRRQQRVLVLLELRGGNDGLNTLGPHRDPTYRRARGALGIEGGLELGQGLLLHPALAPLMSAWESRRLAFALGVGWPKTNRSHFKAIDQWASGSPSGEGPGWLASSLAKGGANGVAVALGPSGSTALEGSRLLALQLEPAQLKAMGERVFDPHRAGDNAVLRKMLELEVAGQQELARLRASLPPLPAALNLPGGDLGQQVALALRLIASTNPPPLIQIAQSGYDTHANQLSRHAHLLGQLAHALAAFDTALQRMSDRPAVTLVSTSEFGRRLQANDSGGTDHGGASVSFVLGDRLPHRLIGRYPSLGELDARGDLIASLSPPDLYRQVLAL